MSSMSSYSRFSRFIFNCIFFFVGIHSSFAFYVFPNSTPFLNKGGVEPFLYECSDLSTVSLVSNVFEIGTFIFKDSIIGVEISTQDGSHTKRIFLRNEHRLLRLSHDATVMRGMGQIFASYIHPKYILNGRIPVSFKIESDSLVIYINSELFHRYKVNFEGDLHISAIYGKGIVSLWN